MCFFNKLPSKEKPKPKAPDEGRAAESRAKELARATGGRNQLTASGPLGVPNFGGGATAMLTG